MTQDDRYARLAAQALLEEPAGVKPPGAEARARAGEAIAEAIRESARAPRRGGWSPGWMAAAAAVALATAAGIVGARSTGPARGVALGAVATAVHGRARVTSGDRERPLAEGAALGKGDRAVVDDDSALSLALPTGTRLLLQHGADLFVVEQGPAQVFHLARGAVRADVAKLHDGERFVVETDDAEVEVRGTSFVVETADPDPACGDGARTRVVVSEGVVTVRTAGVEQRVAAGERWPAACTASTGAPPPESVDPSPPEGVAPAAPAPPIATSSAARAARPARAPATPTGATSATPAPPTAAAPSASLLASQLREQNALFASALSAKRRGDTAGALRDLDALLNGYPTGPLDENARAERMRLLSDDDAVRAAREYLSRYPHGYAHAEAEAIVFGSP
jgi:hypothetical protein